MKKFLTAMFLAMLAAFVVSACGDDDNNSSDSGTDSDTDTDTDTDTDSDSPLTIGVSLMKGPPKPNTDVDIYIANGVGEYVNHVGNAQTEDYYGTASFTIAAADLGVTRIAAGPAEFWDEISELMLTGMRLETFVDTSTLLAPPDPDAGVADGGVEPDSSTINFGVCGHLTARRIQNLMEAATPLTFAGAKVQAETELVIALNAAGIIYTGAWTGCEAIHVIGSDNPDSQYGAALHCAFDKLANMESTDTVEIGPNLQGFLDDYAADLGNDGLVTTFNTDRLKSAVQAIEPMTECIDKLANYIAIHTGETPVSPDANASSDMDLDGIPNSSDPDIDGDGFPNGEDEAPYDTSVGGGMFIDSVNGLGWQITPPTATYAWVAAQTYCDGLDFGGHDDWRMPAYAELETLVYGCDDPPCASLEGPSSEGCYWDLALAGFCDVVYISLDECMTTGKKTFNFATVAENCVIVEDLSFVRCVRTL
jgi:hypothetical protein